MEKIFEINEEETFQKVINTILNNLYFEKVQPDFEIPASILNLAKDELKKIIISQELKLGNICLELNKRYEDKTKIKYLESAIEMKYRDLIFESILDHNSGAVEVMVDFNWKLKLIFGTSSLKSLNYSVLQLIFDTAHCKNASSNVYEMRKEVLAKLISELKTVDCSDSTDSSE